MRRFRIFSSISPKLIARYFLRNLDNLMKICFLGQINQEGNPDGRGTLYFDKEKVERFEGHFSDGNNSYFQNLYGHGCCVDGLTLKQPHGRGFNICIKLY